MAINPNNGVLDIINGTLKVSSIDIKQAGGFTTAINTVARNDVLLFDDQKSTTTFTPTAQGGYMSSTGVTRDTSSNYLELGTASDAGWVYWPLQLPNSWHTEFDMHVTATGGVLTYSLFNTSEPNHTDYTNNDGGYKIVFDNTNNQIVIYWEGSVHKTVSATLRSNDWQHVNINYFQGAISISLAGKAVLTHEFTENYQEFDSRYIGFSATAGTSHKIRHLRVHNSDKWLYTKTSNASDITYVSGNVGIGSLSPTELLDVHGNVHIASDLTVDGNLTVTGTTTYVDTTNATIEDPIIELAKGNTSDTIDAGLIVSRGASNVAIAFRGDEEELAFGYTQSGASDADVTPIANGGLDVRVYGNLFADNLTTTANVEATYLKGNGSEITQVTLDQVVGYANTTANTIQLTNSDVGLKVTGNVEANYFVGNGSELTNISTTLQAISDNGNTSSSTIQFTNATTAFVADSNVGIGTDAPTANLHVMGYQYVNGPPTLTNSFDHSDAPLTLTHDTATSSTAINDPKPLLHLTRDGTTSQSYGARASFNLSRYENSSTHSRSRLDLALADGTYAESTVMTLRADGKVGVGVTSPAYKLDVDGDVNLSTGSTLRINGTPAVFSNWTVSGSDIYRSSGKVGVGTTSPRALLDVSGPVDVPAILTSGASGTEGDIAVLDGEAMQIGHWNSGTSTFTNRIHLNGSGKVGIGASTPQYKLDVDGGTTEGDGDIMLRMFGAVNKVGKLIFGRTGTTDIRSHAIESITNAGGANNYMKFMVHDGGNSPPYETRTEVMTLLGDGNVGIGTSSPSLNLHVMGGIKTQNNGVITPQIQFGSGANNTNGWLVKANVSDTFAGNFSIDRQDNSTTPNKFVIKNNGNVGIGTGSPEQKLHIEDSTNPRILIENTDGTLSLNQDIGSIIFKQNDSTATGTGTIGKIRMSSVTANDGGTFYGEAANMIFSVGKFANDNANIDALTIKNDGNVGIGTNNPKQKLEVHGNILLGENDVQSFIHSGADIAVSADTNVLIVADSNDTSGDAAGNIIFGSGSAINMNSTRDFTYAQAYPSNVPRIEHMRITSDGNVGIGVSPVTPLHVSSTNFVSETAGPASSANTVVRFSSTEVDSTLLFGLSSNASYISSFSKTAFTTEKQLILNANGGNVGIGTNDPRAILHVSSGTTGDCVVRLEADTDNDTETDNARIEFISDGGYNTALVGAGQLPFSNENLNALVLAAYQTIFYTGVQNFTDSTNMLERMRIDENGNVGIGTAGPAQPLHIHNDDEYLYMRFTTTAASTTDTFDIAQWNSTRSNGDRGVMFINRANTDITFDTNDTQRMRIKNDGKVGIGTMSPATKLHVDGSLLLGDRLPYGSAGHTDAQLILGGAHNDSTDYNTVDKIKLLISGGDNDNYSPYFIMCEDENGNDQFYVKGSTSGSGNTAKMYLNGSLGLGTSPTSKLIVQDGSGDNVTTFKVSSGGYLRLERNHSNSPWIQTTMSSGHTGIHLGTGNNDWLIRKYYANLDFDYNGSTKGYLLHNANVGQIDFTGQHRSFIDDVLQTEYDSLEGLIVSANKNKYFDIDENLTTGANAIQISQSIPLVSISTKEKDKACFGVISGSEDPDSRKYEQGSFVTVVEKQVGDRRAFINSIGEGAIWVTNINGNLESGDYITTSNVAGYGMRQDSEFLANYTVAKITMDCDFAPATQPVQIIKKELGNVNYWVETTYSNVALEEYSNLTEENRQMVTTTEYSNDEGNISVAEYSNLESNVQATYSEIETVTYQKIERKESKTEQEGWVSKVREELVNVLDEHGQLQWEDHPTDTEKAYKIRYLTSDGQITDESNAVHIAAFVGCTYHCG